MPENLLFQAIRKSKRDSCGNRQQWMRTNYGQQESRWNEEQGAATNSSTVLFLSYRDFEITSSLPQLSITAAGAADGMPKSRLEFWPDMARRVDFCAFIEKILARSKDHMGVCCVIGESRYTKGLSAWWSQLLRYEQSVKNDCSLMLFGLRKLKNTSRVSITHRWRLFMISSAIQQFSIFLHLHLALHHTLSSLGLLDRFLAGSFYSLPIPPHPSWNASPFPESDLGPSISSWVILVCYFTRLGCFTLSGSCLIP